MFLTSPNQSLQCATVDGINLPYTALDFTTVYIVNSQQKNVASEPICVTGYLDNTFRDLLPGIELSHIQNNIKSIHVVNSDNIPHTLTFRLVDSGNARNIYKCILQPNWTVSYQTESGWSIYDQYGVKKKAEELASSANPASGVTVEIISTLIISGNDRRTGLTLTNTGSNPIFIGINQSAQANKGMYILANGGVWEMDKYSYSNKSIYGIAIGGTTNLSIQEWE